MRLSAVIKEIEENAAEFERISRGTPVTSQHDDLTNAAIAEALTAVLGKLRAVTEL